MVSKALLPLGVLVAVVLSVLVVLGVLLEAWLLAAAAGCALISASLLVALDAWRRVRTLRTFVRDEVRQAAVRQAKAARVVKSVDPPPGAVPEVVDVVRLLQAQYVGRLDRLQASVEALVDHTVPRDDGCTAAESSSVEPAADSTG